MFAFAWRVWLRFPLVAFAFRVHRGFRRTWQVCSKWISAASACSRSFRRTRTGSVPFVLSFPCRERACSFFGCVLRPSLVWRCVLFVQDRLLGCCRSTTFTMAWSFFVSIGYTSSPRLGVFRSALRVQTPPSIPSPPPPSHQVPTKHWSRGIERGRERDRERERERRTGKGVESPSTPMHPTGHPPQQSGDAMGSGMGMGTLDVQSPLLPNLKEEIHSTRVNPERESGSTHVATTRSNAIATVVGSHEPTTNEEGTETFAEQGGRGKRAYEGSTWHRHKEKWKGWKCWP